MSATDELCRLLDERGESYIRHGDDMVTWRYYTDPHSAIETLDGTLQVTGISPEQAVAATLGAGTCKLHDCEGSFSTASRSVWRCDCGAFMTQYTDASTYHKPRYCPNCGRKVVAP